MFVRTRILFLILMVIALAGCQTDDGVTNPEVGQFFTVRAASDTFVMYTKDPETIRLAKENFEGKNTRFPIGKIAVGNGGFNGIWGWHFVPDNVRMTEVAMEVCDGTPSYVNTNLDDYLASGVLPVGSQSNQGWKIGERMKAVLAALLTLTLSVVLSAETAKGSTEITVYSGWSFLDADYSFNLCPECLGPIDYTIHSTLESSVLFGFKGGVYLNHSMQVEGNFGLAPGRDLGQQNNLVCIPELPCPAGDVVIYFPGYFTDSNAVSYHYSGNFVYNLETSGVTPFFTFGVGGISTDTIADTETDFAINLGAGAKFYFEKVGLRFEVNDHVIPDHFLTGKTEHDIQVQYGFIFRLS